MVDEEEEACIGVTIIEDVVDSDNKELCLSTRLRATIFSEYKDAKVDCFETRVDGILELIVGSEMQEMKPIKRTQRKNQALLSRKKIELVNRCSWNVFVTNGVFTCQTYYIRLLILF